MLTSVQLTMGAVTTMPHALTQEEASPVNARQGSQEMVQTVKVDIILTLYIFASLFPVCFHPNLRILLPYSSTHCDWQT